MSEAKLDQTDRKIILQLQRDGRAPTSEIAREVGVSEPTVRRKIAAMQASGLLSIRASVEPALLGYATHAMIGIDVERAQIAPVAQALAAYPFVSTVAVSTGRYDLMIEASFETLRDLHDFVMVELSSLTAIRDSQSFLVMRHYKYDAMTGVAGLEPEPASLPHD